MKKSIYSMGLAALMLTPMLISCETQEHKDGQVQAAQAELDQLTKDAADKAAKDKQAEEWAAFKQETLTRIQANTDRIAELRVKKAKPGKVLDPLYAAKIDALQERNNDLRGRLDAYEKENSDWESFKREFNSDMEGLGKAFEDLGTDNKK